MNFIDNLYRPISMVGENIDSRYFTDNGDGTYNCTPLFIRNMARDAAEFFKKRIFALDENHQFSSSSIRVVKDTWAEKLHKDAFEEKYGEKIAEATKKWYKYRDEHPDEFETRFKRVAIGGVDEARFFAGYTPIIQCSLTQAVQVYNAANELLARFDAPKNGNAGGAEYNTLPFEEPLYSKAEFAEKHKQIREEFSKELGIPDDNFEVGTVEKDVFRINNKRCIAVGSDDDLLADFTTGLMEHLTSSTKEQWLQARKNCETLINKDFVVMFNNNAHYLKAVENSTDIPDITIWTQYTDNMSPCKFISIKQENPEDDYYMFYFSAKADDDASSELSFQRRITTKEDIRKALVLVIAMCETSDLFSIYTDELNNILDNV